MIDLPTKGFISTIQANMKRKKMGFRSSARSIEKNYENIYDASKDESIAERHLLKREGHTLVSTSKSKRVCFPHVPKILCQVCMTKIMVENVFINCHNCDSDIMVKQT